jgi:2,5-diketo-D-gluconate reductase A
MREPGSLREPGSSGQDACVTREWSVEIAPGVRMPLLGLGTWEARGAAVERAVEYALEIGYRHIDTALMYGNERQVGRGLVASGVPRDDVFITTKLWPDRAGRERATLEESLGSLGLERVDLWLIHWPPGGRARPDVWEKFIEAQADGLATAIGVSNYTVDQIDELERATGRLPAVNQIEWSPSLYDADEVNALRERGVTLEGYSPLKTTNLADPRLVRTAEAHGVTPVQVVIRWHLQHEIVVIPKSTHEERIRENWDVFGFELSDDELAELDGFSARA